MAASKNLTRDEASRIISLIDLTTLGGTDHAGTVARLCQQALKMKEVHGLACPAAVCVYPVFVKLAVKELEGSGIKVASVAGAFPSGQSPLRLRLDEVRFCLDEGADEIDMVISRGRLMAGDTTFISEEISAMKTICGDKHLKAIIESGELKDEELISSASDLCLDAGADFIKTSTGKISPAATPEASGIMLERLRKYREITGKVRGFKAAGGIATVEDAQTYILMAEQVMGRAFIDASTFRIGASRLLNKVLEAARII